MSRQERLVRELSRRATESLIPFEFPSTLISRPPCLPRDGPSILIRGRRFVNAESIMTRVSILGIPHDDNSSYLKGPSEAPPLIRRELHNDAYSMWTETGFDLGVADRLVDHGDIYFDGAKD